MLSLICVWIYDWVNNREAGDLKRHRGHYDVNVIVAVLGIHAGTGMTSIVQCSYLIIFYSNYSVLLARMYAVGFHVCPLFPSINRYAGIRRLCLEILLLTFYPQDIWTGITTCTSFFRNTCMTFNHSQINRYYVIVRSTSRDKSGVAKAAFEIGIVNVGRVVFCIIAYRSFQFI